MLKTTAFRRAIYSTKTCPCLKCGPKPVDARVRESVNFRPQYLNCGNEDWAGRIENNGIRLMSGTSVQFS